MADLSPHLITRREPFPDTVFAARAHNVPIVEDGIGLGEVWRVIRRRLWLTVYLFLTVVLLTGVAVFLKTPAYTARTILLIEPETPQVLDMTQLIADSAGDADYDYYKTQFELLKSRVLAARVIQQLGLDGDPAFNPTNLDQGPVAAKWNSLKAWFDGLWASPSSETAGPPQEDSVNQSSIDRYLSHLKVEPKAGTRLVTVSFTLTKPSLAARVVNSHVTEFVRLGLEMHSEGQRTVRDFLKSQLVDIDKRVRASEAALNAYRQQNGVISFDVDDADKVAQQRMSDLTRALTDAETGRIAAESQMTLVQHGDYESLPEVVNNPTISSLRPQLINLETEYARLATAFNPAYPKLAELKAQLGQAKAAMSAEIRDVAEAVQRNYEAALKREQELTTEVQAEKQKDLALNNALVEDAVLAREVETNRDLYKAVLQRMQQIALVEQTPLSNISIVEGAVPPLAPSSPKKLIDLSISGLIALMAGLALSFLLDHLDSRLKSSEEAEQYLSLPNLAVVPDFDKLGTGNRVRRALTANGLTGSQAQRRPRNAKSSPPALEGYLTGKGEIYRTIRTSILFSRASAPPKTILFTSSLEAEGKTWTVVNTALTFAHTGARILLIDADLRRPNCHRMLQCENTVGLSEVLVGQCEASAAIYRVRDHSLFFLSAGSHVPNPAELLTSVKMREVLANLGEAYDFILIDTAPLMHASDTVGIATMVEGVVMVVGANTAKQIARNVRDRLSQVNARILGVVLNRVNIRHPDYYEHSRYYFSYDDSYHDDDVSAGNKAIRQ